MNNISKNFKLTLSITVVLILATVLVTGCIKHIASSQTGIVSDIMMSTGVDSNNRPVNPTTVFAVDAQGFYCSFKLYGFPVGAKLQAQWTYLGGDPEAEAITGKNYVVDTQQATIAKEGQGYTSTVLTRPEIPDYTFPKGDYKVVISVDGLEKASTTFKLQ
jgi:hypothetical protein